jgi:hypothetical protein
MNDCIIFFILARYERLQMVGPKLVRLGSGKRFQIVGDAFQAFRI